MYNVLSISFSQNNKKLNEIIDYCYREVNNYAEDVIFGDILDCSPIPPCYDITPWHFYCSLAIINHHEGEQMW